MMTRVAILCAVAVAILVVAPAAQADPMPLDGSWIILDENMTAPAFFTGNWDWNSAAPVLFKITDLYVITDVFEVYDDGVLVLTTPTLSDASTPNIDDPDVAWLMPAFSKGSIVFGAGYHNITIKDIHIPFTYPDGTVAFSAVTVPVPAAVLLGMLGLSVAGARLRKRSA